MPESQRWKMTRKNLVINNALQSAQSNLFALFYLYLREHPGLADYIETMLLQLAETRTLLRDFQFTCWETIPPQFDDVGDMDDLIKEARHDVLGELAGCRGYLVDWAVGERQLSQLLSELDKRSRKQSDGSSPSRPKLPYLR